MENLDDISELQILPFEQKYQTILSVYMGTITIRAGLNEWKIEFMDLFTKNGY